MFFSIWKNLGKLWGTLCAQVNLSMMALGSFGVCGVPGAAWLKEAADKWQETSSQQTFAREPKKSWYMINLEDVLAWGPGNLSRKQANQGNYAKNRDKKVLSKCQCQTTFAPPPPVLFGDHWYFLHFDRGPSMMGMGCVSVGFPDRNPRVSCRCIGTSRNITWYEDKAKGLNTI